MATTTSYTSSIPHFSRSLKSSPIPCVKAPLQLSPVKQSLGIRFSLRLPLRGFIQSVRGIRVRSLFPSCPNVRVAEVTLSRLIIGFTKFQRDNTLPPRLIMGRCLGSGSRTPDCVTHLEDSSNYQQRAKQSAGLGYHEGYRRRESST